MTNRLFPALGLLLLAACAGTPPALPPAAPVAPPPPRPAEPDDDHRSVSLAAFQASPWAGLGPVQAWSAVPGGAVLTLGDGRQVSLTFVAPRVVRLWVPAAAGEAALSPGMPVSPSLPPVQTQERGGALVVATTGLEVEVRLSDLSWTLRRGEALLLRSAGGPVRAGRRLRQAFDAALSPWWQGPGWTGTTGGAKFWNDNRPNADGTGPFAAPALAGAGGPGVTLLSLDTSYQSYTSVDAAQVSLGALNGGLDLYVATAPDGAAALEALSALAGRAPRPPLSAHVTALLAAPEVWPAALTRARLSLQPVTSPSLPDWVGRYDFDPVVSRENNRGAAQAAAQAAQAARAAHPGARLDLRSPAGGLGSLRWAAPELVATPGRDAAVLDQALRLSAVGQGTPAIRLDLSDLADGEGGDLALRRLAGWLLAPQLSLDWGPDPEKVWQGLSEPRRQRLKALLDRRSVLKTAFAGLALRAARTGRPAWLPPALVYGADPAVVTANGEVLVGDDLLAAPTFDAAATRQVTLPGPGVWFDFWTGLEYGGGRTYSVDVPPDRPLLFARAGSLIPVREPEAFDGKDVFNPLTIHVFPGGSGQTSYLVDDGRSEAWAAGGQGETLLRYGSGQKLMSLEHETLSSAAGLRPDPYLLYRLHNVYKPKQVTIEGKPLPLFGDSWGITDTDRSAAWYESDHTLLIKTFRPERSQTILISF